MTAPLAPFTDWPPLFTDEQGGFHVWYDAKTVSVFTQTFTTSGDLAFVQAYVAVHDELRALVQDDIRRAHGLHNLIDMRSIGVYEARARSELTRWMKGRGRAETRRADIAANLNPIVRIGMETVSAVAGAFGAYRPHVHRDLEAVLAEAGLTEPPEVDEELARRLREAVALRKRAATD